MTEKYKMLIGGKWVFAKEYFNVLNPYNGEIIGLCPTAELKDVNDAVDSAKAAFKKISSLSLYKRSKILENTSSLILEYSEVLAKLIVLESGKAYKYALSEVKRAAETFKFASLETNQIHGETLPIDAALTGEGRFAVYKPFPIGVIAAISPFNFPLNLVAHKVAPAIASGNTVVLKPAEKTPLTALKLGEIMAEAGLPGGALNIITGDGAFIGDILIKHPDISMISFTGSPKVGLIIKEKAGMKKTVLELGSNSGLIVEPDTDIDEIIPRCILGTFANSGQVCISVQRIFVHKDIFESFSNKFVSAAEKIKLGNPMDKDTEYGPMIEDAETKRILKWIEEAKLSGAKVLTGGVLNELNILLPTILTDVRNDMKVCSNEAFAPIATLTPYVDFEDAMAMLNESIYGLQAGVYTKDINKAFKAFDRLHVGGVIINDIPTYRTDNIPYGGVKLSGSGREGVKFSIAEMMELKLLVVNLPK